MIDVFFFSFTKFDKICNNLKLQTRNVFISIRNGLISRSNWQGIILVEIVYQDC